MLIQENNKLAGDDDKEVNLKTNLKPILK